MRELSRLVLWQDESDAEFSLNSSNLKIIDYLQELGTDVITYSFFATIFYMVNKVEYNA